VKVVTYFEAIETRAPGQRDQWHEAWRSAGFEPIETGRNELRKSRWWFGASTAFGRPPSPRPEIDRACFFRWFAYATVAGPEPVSEPILCVDYDCFPGHGFSPADVDRGEVVIYDSGAVPTAVSVSGRGLSTIHDMLLKDDSLRKDAWYCDMLVFQHNRHRFKVLDQSNSFLHGQ